MRSIYRCWCDNHAAAFHDFGKNQSATNNSESYKILSAGLFFTFYIIEVEMKPQSAGIVYRAEDGCRYERQHGSTTNLDMVMVDNSPLSMSSVRCHRCGEMGHKATNCQTGKNKKVQVNCLTSVSQGNTS